MKFIVLLALIGGCCSAANATEIISPCGPDWFKPTSDLVIGRIHGTDGAEVFMRENLGDEESCKGENDCRGDVQLAEGAEIVFTGQVSQDTCAITVTSAANTALTKVNWGWVDRNAIILQPESEPTDWTGSYGSFRFGAHLVLIRNDDGTYEISGSTTDGAEEGAREAIFVGEGQVEKNFLTAINQYTHAYSNSCTLTMRRFGAFLFVSEDRFCGPPNAGFSGVYWETILPQ